MHGSYYVYILTSHSRVLYIGVTNNLIKRVTEHRDQRFGGFTTKYKVYSLVYFEQFGDARVAIGREKQLKGYRREKKIALIDRANPEWRDLFLDLR